MAFSRKLLTCLTALCILLVSLLPACSATAAENTQTLCYGDIDEDGSINSIDALTCLQYSVGLADLDTHGFLLADVNADQEVNSGDALYILQQIVGIVTEFPAVRYYGTGELTGAIKAYGYEKVDESQYWNYNQLTSAQKSVYRIMNKKAQYLTRGEFEVGGNDLEFMDVFIAYMALHNDHPEYFWLSRSCMLSRYAGKTYAAFSSGNQVDYNFTKAQAASMQYELFEMVGQAFADCLKPGMSEYERQIALHDWLIEHCNYNDAAADNSKANPSAYESYGALVQGSAVCEGYSRAYQLLCYYAGINCTLATGEDLASGGPHMWNLVFVEGEPYFADLTWDDGLLPSYDFFNQTTEQMNQTHRLEPNLNTLTNAQLEEMSTVGFNFNLPVCTATQNNYFVKNGLLASSPADFASIFPAKAVQAANAGKKQIHFWCSWRTFSNPDDIHQLISPLIGQINGQITNRYNQIHGYQISYIPGSSSFTVIW